MKTAEYRAFSRNFSPSPHWYSPSRRELPGVNYFYFWTNFQIQENTGVFYRNVFGGSTALGHLLGASLRLYFCKPTKAFGSLAAISRICFVCRTSCPAIISIHWYAFKTPRNVCGQRYTL